MDMNTISTMAKQAFGLFGAARSDAYATIAGFNEHSAVYSALPAPTYKPSASAHNSAADPNQTANADVPMV